jgi:Trk K+ transport system NAD-binding subunit
LIEWLTGTRHQELPMPVYPPSGGLWILCGYGRFGKAVYERLVAQGIRTVIIEADPHGTQAPDDVVVGRGTEAVTLREAHIEQAAGLVAGTDSDVNNLSIIMTARELNPKLFVVVRQNLKSNESIVEAAKADMVMHPSAIIANKIRVLLATPLVSEFVKLARGKDDDWACELVSRIIALVSQEVPEIWQVRLSTDDTHAICNAVKSGDSVTLGDIVKDPRERSRDLLCIPLVLLRKGELSLLPPDDLCLEEDDRVLFCGRYSAYSSMEWTLQNEHALTYVRTGGSAPQGMIWRMLRRTRGSATEKVAEGPQGG